MEIDQTSVEDSFWTVDSTPITEPKPVEFKETRELSTLIERGQLNDDGEAVVSVSDDLDTLIMRSLGHQASQPGRRGRARHTRP